MAKRLENPFEIKIVINQDGTEVNVSAHYGMACEYGGLNRKGLMITLTPNQETQVVNMAKDIILPQVKAWEKI